jgi:hypothetical protein
LENRVKRLSPVQQDSVEAGRELGDWAPADADAAGCGLGSLPCCMHAPAASVTRADGPSACMARCTSPCVPVVRAHVRGCGGARQRAHAGLAACQRLPWGPAASLAYMVGAEHGDPLVRLQSAAEALRQCVTMLTVGWAHVALALPSLATFAPRTRHGASPGLRE